MCRSHAKTEKKDRRRGSSFLDFVAASRTLWDVRQPLFQRSTFANYGHVFLDWQIQRAWHAYHAWPGIFQNKAPGPVEIPATSIACIRVRNDLIARICVSPRNAKRLRRSGLGYAPKWLSISVHRGED